MHNLLVFLLLFFGILLCLMLVSSVRSFLRSAMRFAWVQQQQVKERLTRNIKLLNRHRSTSDRHEKLFSSNVAIEVNSTVIKDRRMNASHLVQLTSSLSRSIKKRAKFVAIFAIALIAGHGMSSQLAAQVPPPFQPLTSLKTVPVPGPSDSELNKYIKDRNAATVLGKALFWDMQVGSDGIQTCATCHYHAGADSRSKNQISPGLLRANQERSLNSDITFQTGGPNYTLQPGDFPFHKLSDPNNRESDVVTDSNDATSSQGVINTEFADVTPGSAEDKVNFLPDPVFNVKGTATRRVEPLNAPTAINAVFNFRNTWQGRAQNIFNGVNPFGTRDPNAYVLKATSPTAQPQPVRVNLKDSALASQALGPTVSSFEMSADGRTFEEIGQKFGLVDKRSRAIAKGRKLPRKMAKKLFGVKPLAKQLVARDDSVLGSFSKFPKKGIKPTYETLVRSAFRPEWWESNYIVRVNQDDGSREILPRPNRFLATNEYTLAEFNFSLFFGLAIQMYESTLVSNNAPLDQYLEGNSTALTDIQKRGLETFKDQGKCITCHGGAELTNASVKSVRNQPLKRMRMGDGNTAVYDNGFYNIGVKPTFEDLLISVGSVDPAGNPLSMVRLAQVQGETPVVPGEPGVPSGPLDPNERVAVDGAVKTPGLRNVELTAPYFHNGGQLTLEQVVKFYNRGGDRRGPNGNDTTEFPPNTSNLDQDIQSLGLSESQQAELVEFMKALTDERVRYHKAPFDHPQLFVPNGHPGDQNSVTPDTNGNATDSLLEIPAVGRKGGDPLPNFLANSQP